MPAKMDNKFIEDIANPENRSESLKRYGKYARFHNTMFLMTAVAFIVFQYLDVDQVTPLFVFLSLINALIAQKYESTRQLILAVDYMESSKIDNINTSKNT